jgi:selenocysteine-specific elongation factor
VQGDRFVLRTPNDTVGGGEVVAIHARRHKRFDDATIAQLEAQRAGDLIDLGGALMTGASLAELTNRARSTVASYMDEHPLRWGMAVDELGRRLQMVDGLFDVGLERWCAEGLLARHGDVVAVAGRVPRLTARQQQTVDVYLAVLRKKPFAPPTDTSIDDELVTYLKGAGLIVPVGGGVVFAAEAYREMAERIREHLRRDGSISLAQTRDMFGTTRKYAQALLEHLDHIHVTTRVGDERVLAER